MEYSKNVHRKMPSATNAGIMSGVTMISIKKKNLQISKKKKCLCKSLKWICVHFLVSICLNEPQTIVLKQENHFKKLFTQ